MTSTNDTDESLASILSRVNTIALIGASDKPTRPSHGVMQFLLSKGYIVTPVNPRLEGQELLGCKVYASLEDIPGSVDMADIFRNSGAAREAVRDCIRAKSKLGLTVVWMQLGVINQEAAREAEAAGLEVVMDRCPVIEYKRLSLERSVPVRNLE